jgi:UDP-glucuronate decarboxylase
MKTILITGGAGFIGTNLITRLFALHGDMGCRIICIDNLITGSLGNIRTFIESTNDDGHPLYNFVFLNHDICKPIVLDDESIDEIYHLASLASPVKYKLYPLETLFTSINGTQNVLELCIRYKCRLLFTSTSEVYGDPLVHPQPEEYFGNVNTVGERSCYDEGKRVCETMLYEYRRLHGLDLKIVRIFNTYGPFMDINDGRVITNFIGKIMAQEPVEIYGDGTQTRSFCYIDDMLNGLIAMMNSHELGPINLGNPDCEFTLNELVGVFEKVLGKEVMVKYLDGTPDDPKVRKPVLEKAWRLLGWAPVVDLKSGIASTFAHFSGF